MAYGGGIFLPSETAYKDPNRFRDVLQAEGNKEAAYLADMDQFYAELDEMKRQFDITAEMKDRQFEESLAFGREKLEWQSGENELDRALKRYEIGENVSLGRAELAMKKSLADSQLAGQQLSYAADLAKIGLQKEQFAETQSMNQFYRSLYMSREGREQQAFDVVKNRVGGGGGSEGTSGISGVSDSYYNPYGSQSISDFLGDVSGSPDMGAFDDDYYNWY